MEEFETWEELNKRLEGLFGNYASFPVKLKERSKEDAGGIVLREQAKLTRRENAFPLEKPLMNIWAKKFTSWLTELGTTTAGPSDDTVKHVNKSKEKAQDAQLVKDRKKVQSFLSFTSRSEVGVTAKEVFEQSTDVPLPQLTCILNNADRALKKARLDAGSTADVRVHTKKEDQLKVTTASPLSARNKSSRPWI